MTTNRKGLALPERIIAFADLTGYHRIICTDLALGELFAFLESYYEIAQHCVADSDGTIVKFIGDAILITFPASCADGAIRTLRTLKERTDAFLFDLGYESRLSIKAHVGIVAEGWMGEGELKRWDVCGLAVNHAARLPGGEWVLSEELKAKILT